MLDLWSHPCPPGSSSSAFTLRATGPRPSSQRFPFLIDSGAPAQTRNPSSRSLFPVPYLQRPESQHSFQLPSFRSQRDLTPEALFLTWPFSPAPSELQLSCAVTKVWIPFVLNLRPSADWMIYPKNHALRWLWGPCTRRFDKRHASVNASCHWPVPWKRCSF